MIGKPVGGSGGISTFTGLTDTPSTFSGQKGREYIVNNAENALIAVLSKFPVAMYGAVGDAKAVNDGNITATSDVFSTSAKTLFTSSDVGKTIAIRGAGAAGANLTTTIAEYLSTSSVKLTDAASTTIVDKQAVWGTENTAAFQSAYDACYAYGGGRMIVDVGNFLCTGYLDFYRTLGGILKRVHVSFEGDAHGPFEAHADAGGVGGTSIGAKTVPYFPMIMITDTVNDFLQLNGYSGFNVSDLAFYYPLQVHPTEATPIVYPWTINLIPYASACSIRRCSFINSYKALKYHGGRGYVTDNFFGCYLQAAEFDHVRDFLWIENNMVQMMYNFIEGYGGTQPIDAWVNINGYGFVFLGGEAFHLHGFKCFSRAYPIKIARSSDTGQFNGGVSYGEASDIHLDLCHIGVWIENCYALGWDFVNLAIATLTGSASYVKVDAGSMRWNGGKVWNSVPTTPLDIAAGAKFSFDNVYGLSNKAGFTQVGNMGVGTITPTQKLEINGKIKISNDAGAAAGGVMRYDSSTGKFEGYDAVAAAWVEFGGGGGGIDGGLFTDTYTITGVDGGAFI